MSFFFPADLPQNLQTLSDLVLDLRWTWSHKADVLWRMLDEETWERTKNPWTLLQHLSKQRLQQLAEDEEFCQELNRLTEERTSYLSTGSWYDENKTDLDIGKVAYFSMEFGLGEALPIYAGGLGILAGDYLKTASDLGLTVIGIGLLYQEGYFRQMLDAQGHQLAIYPYNEPSTLPIQPLCKENGECLYITLNLPGRKLMLRVWQVNVGRVQLYLLDSNDPINSPLDRGITSKLYGGNNELRFLQELVLGIGGWRLLDAIGDDISVCHLNEGHAAFVVLERARQYMEQKECSFQEAVWATRAGNIFTTHTPVVAGFDTFQPQLIEKYFPIFHNFLSKTGLTLQQLLALGRENPNDTSEPFNMAYLAMRGCARSNGVSELHGKVSRQLFKNLYPRWPKNEVPVSHVTNGIHVPSWDSSWADKLWTDACGKQRWLGNTESLHHSIQAISDETLWTLRTKEREDLLHYARKRLAIQMGQIGASPEQIDETEQVLDPNALTLGFARRFATYKRPNLLLHDKARLIRLLTNNTRPVQLIIAGKAHPSDANGQLMIKQWIDFVSDPSIRGHVVFLEDYDIALAQHLVQGVDVWINTPRRPWEACGTSGMKILANGGLNLSELDGWWAEAFSENVGWFVGDGQEHGSSLDWDHVEAEQLYQRLENEIIPLFYNRDAQGIPRQWLRLVRNSLMTLAPQFSSNRMVREYVEKFYHPAHVAYKQRESNKGEIAKQLFDWSHRLQQHWEQIHFSNLEITKSDAGHLFKIHIYLGEISPDEVQVELYSDLVINNAPLVIQCQCHEKISGAIHGYCYQADIETRLDPNMFTPRVVPYHADAQIPAEQNLILWHH
ncbi:MAG: alpha-glucan family phosphorylase [Methylophaga sp.]|nr:alpha-glucan family phosphorylase [Methylophaga sp.]